MEKKLIYLAHPITGSPDRTQAYNMACICILYRELVKHDIGVVPFAPYFASMECLDNFNPGDRMIGILLNKIFFDRKAFDELWICGKMSNGVQQEVEWARDGGIPVIDKTTWAYNVFTNLHGQEFAEKWRA